MPPALQPGLRPTPPWALRALALAGIAAALSLFAFLGGPRRTPPRLLLSGPRHEHVYAREVARLIDGARERVWVMMYVMYTDGEAAAPLERALLRARERGVRVQVCLDYGPDFGQEEPSQKHAPPQARLEAGGVRVVLDEASRRSHGKVVVVDGRWCVVGSHNWTSAAMMANREASLLVEDSGMAELLERWFAAIPGWDPES